MVLSFFGAAQTVTGSKHLVTLENGKRILLDCGMFQGKGNDNRTLNRELNFDASSIDYLILSHAHTDHSGLIPYLVKQGFSGPIFCTPPTLALCELLFRDSAKIQYFDWKNGTENPKNGTDADEGPLFEEQDVVNSLKLFKTVPYEKPFRIDEDVELIFTDAGHVLGSAAVNLKIKEKGHIRTLCFTGDIGRFANRILRPPQPFPQAEIIICESTYGDKFHATIEQTEERLEEIVKQTCVEKGGKLLIPSFSIGRTQELIYSLNYLAEENRLPADLKVFVDSPLSVYATDILRDNMEYFNDDMLEYIKFDPDPFGFPQLHFIIDQDDSKLLNALDEPCIIISSSGMMEAGRILHHLKNNIADPRTTILITGYCEPSTLGGKIMRGAKSVSILEQELEVNAEVIIMKEYSAHGDYGDILKFLFSQDKDKIQKIFLVHGEFNSMKKFKKDLEEADYKNIEIAEFRISYEV